MDKYVEPFRGNVGISGTNPKSNEHQLGQYKWAYIVIGGDTRRQHIVNHNVYSDILKVSLLAIHPLVSWIVGWRLY